MALLPLSLGEKGLISLKQSLKPSSCRKKVTFLFQLLKLSDYHLSNSYVEPSLATYSREPALAGGLNLIS